MQRAMGRGARERSTRALALAIRGAYPRVAPQVAWRIAADTILHAGRHGVWSAEGRMPAGQRVRLAVIAWVRHHQTAYDGALASARERAGVARADSAGPRRATLHQLQEALERMGVGADAVFGGGAQGGYDADAGEGTRASGKSRAHFRQGVQAGGAARV